MLLIIDYNAGNPSSIKNMLNKVGVTAVISHKRDEIEKATAIILPGVGKFDYGMNNLNNMGISDMLKTKVLCDNTPLLGICLGAQLLFESSEEGEIKGLGLIKGCVKRFSVNSDNIKLKIPHMGWNSINIIKDNPLTSELASSPRFYFVHSYYMQCESTINVLAESFHGSNFHSIVNEGNVFGVQFHPEKSHRYGMKLLENFIKIGKC